MNEYCKCKKLSIFLCLKFLFNLLYQNPPITFLSNILTNTLISFEWAACLVFCLGGLFWVFCSENIQRKQNKLFCMSVVHHCVSSPWLKIVVLIRYAERTKVQTESNLNSVTDWAVQTRRKSNQPKFTDTNHS